MLGRSWKDRLQLFGESVAHLFLQTISHSSNLTCDAQTILPVTSRVGERVAHGCTPPGVRRTSAIAWDGSWSRENCRLKNSTSPVEEEALTPSHSHVQSGLAVQMFWRGLLLGRANYIRLTQQDRTIFAKCFTLTILKATPTPTN